MELHFYHKTHPHDQAHKANRLSSSQGIQSSSPQIDISAMVDCLKTIRTVLYAKIMYSYKHIQMCHSY